MTTTSAHLVTLCRASGARPEPVVIDNLARVLDGPTVSAMIDLMQGVDMQVVFFKFAKRSLTPMEVETLAWIERERFVSSREVSAQFDIKQSTAVNRLVLLRNKGVLTEAFKFLPGGGGSRQYFRAANGALDESAVDHFVAGLGEGRKR